MNEQGQLQLEAEILDAIDSGRAEIEIPIQRITARTRRNTRTIERSLTILMADLGCTSQRAILIEARRQGILPSQRRTAA